MKGYRHEYKYSINACQEEILKIQAGGLMELDKFAKATGLYRIRSLYLDDVMHSCYWEKEEGIDPRAKYRIRYYNNDLEMIRLEKKIKYRGMTRKESCVLTKEECQLILAKESIPVQNGDSEIKVRLLNEIMMKNLTPSVIVSYDRIPYVHDVGNVRVTFDKNITASCDTDLFLEASYTERPILALGQCILEVKYDELLPDLIKHSLQISELNWTSFSKYCQCLRWYL